MTAALHVCPSPSCSALIPKGVRLCPRCTREARAREPRRPSPAAMGYGYAHRKMREQIAREEDRCRFCPSTGPWVADHLIPLSEGGTDDRSNYGRVCVTCHNRKHPRGFARRREEAHG